MPPEPEVLFSPLPPDEPMDRLTAERQENSNLFDLSRLGEIEANAAPSAVPEESSGVVVIASPSKHKRTGDSSGLVRVGALKEAKPKDVLAEDQPTTPDPLPPTPSPLANPLGIPVDLPEPAKAAPAVPTPILIAVVVGLVAAVAVLTWKALAG